MSGTNELQAVRYFFVVGAPKAATTWLSSQLSEHSQVHLSRVKEPHFFAPPVPGEMAPDAATDDNVWQKLAEQHWLHSGWIQDPAVYERLMRPESGELVSGEATVAYLHSSKAAQRIVAGFPDARIIVILREPVSRAVSHYQMDALLGRCSSTAENTLRRELTLAREGKITETRYLGRSLYADAVRRYIRAFGNSHVLALRYDDVRSSPMQLLRNVADFLQISPEGFVGEIGRRINSRHAVRWPWLNQWLVRSGAKAVVRKTLPRFMVAIGKKHFYVEDGSPSLSDGLTVELRDYFEADIINTAQVTGLDLSGWLTRSGS